MMIWVQLCAAAAAISLGLLWIIGRLSPRTPAPATLPAPPTGITRFLFDGDTMFDHDAGALPPGGADPLEWSRLHAWLAPRFDGLPDSLLDVTGGPSLHLRAKARDDTARLKLLRTEHSTQVILIDPAHPCPAERHDMLMAKARMDEITAAFEEAPIPIWKTGPEGETLWRNAASHAAFEPALYDTARLSGAPQGAVMRLPITPESGGRAKWFEVTRAAHPWGTLHHAADITKIVNAERMQKDFVQTLTKTFAYLTVGLAVFDRTRKLALFNPALVDLTSLGAEFLSAQPDLMAFFDQLRDRRVMPEPRSYASWRTQIGEVIGAAEGGLYQETWSLPNDVTYRVTGRPHPDGAVAFLFEDISAEVMLARRFRSQLDLRQAALDCLPEAVIVIGPSNVLAFCNASAIRLLGVDPDTAFADMSTSDLIRACAEALPAPDIWSDVEAQLKQRQPSSPLRKSAEISQGHRLSYRVELLAGGARMLILHSQVDANSKPQARLAAG
ncbi:PAS-domain containing protein [Roseovarius aquimarinus]|uniref:PAS-domain containing protein n=1 Tax=Roseovarius aquimarinus TaxID=1229156 RepID=A0ABW7IAW1_9RHOB